MIERVIGEVGIFKSLGARSRLYPRRFCMRRHLTRSTKLGLSGHFAAHRTRNFGQSSSNVTAFRYLHFLWKIKILLFFAMREWKVFFRREHFWYLLTNLRNFIVFSYWFHTSTNISCHHLLKSVQNIGDLRTYLLVNIGVDTAENKPTYDKNVSIVFC